MRTINAKELRATLPKVVARVRRGERYTVIYRSEPAFQIVPVEAEEQPLPPLEDDPVLRTRAVGRSKTGRRAVDHDKALYGK